MRNIIRTLFTVTGSALVFVVTAGSASAVDVNTVPELSPGAFGSALTLLTAGVLCLAGSRRSQK